MEGWNEYEARRLTFPGNKKRGESVRKQSWNQDGGSAVSHCAGPYSRRVGLTIRLISMHGQTEIVFMDGKLDTPSPPPLLSAVGSRQGCRGCFVLHVFVCCESVRECESARV